MRVDTKICDNGSILDEIRLSALFIIGFWENVDEKRTLDKVVLV